MRIHCFGEGKYASVGAGLNRNVYMIMYAYAGACGSMCVDGCVHMYI